MLESDQEIAFAGYSHLGYYVIYNTKKKVKPQNHRTGQLVSLKLVWVFSLI